MSELEKVTAVDTTYDASEIQVLEGLEAVRKRPGMYIGSTSASGLHHLVYEIVDNAIDEALAGYCTEITVTINPGNTITVTDNGRGIPVDIQKQTGRPALEVVYTVLHAGGKFGGGGYKVSGGLHGVGASVVNALSEWLEVQVQKDGRIYEMKFSRGAITQEMKILGDTDQTGTAVTFKPDPEMFDTLVYDYETLHTRMREQAFLNAGLRITITDARPGQEQSDSMCYEGGIREFVTWLNRNKTALHEEVVYLAGAKGDSTAEVALQYNDSYNETLVSFANDIHTPEGGMHETGFKTALTRVLNAYGMKYGMIKEGDKVSGEDVREGITAVISVKLTEAQFEGQTKAKLGNASIRTLVDSVVSDQLAVYLEEHPVVARTILDKALTANRAREAARKARESIRRKTALGGAAMPDKLRDCNENNPELTEIYIVEGDSAGGSATQGRDSRFQAILPLWGKMLNVEKARADKIYGNDKLMPVVLALGCGLDILETMCRALHSQSDFAAAGLNAHFICGATKAADRTAALRELKDPACPARVLFATYQLAKEGLDIPCAGRLYLVQPVRDKVSVQQAVGRIMRPAPGKTTALVYDFVDNNVPACRSQYAARRRVYKQLNAEILEETTL